MNELDCEHCPEKDSCKGRAIVETLESCLKDKVGVEVEFTAIRSKARQIIEAFSKGITEEEYHAVSMAVSYPYAVLVPKLFEDMTWILEHEKQLAELTKVASLVGYYMGKTGEKFEGV